MTEVTEDKEIILDENNSSETICNNLSEDNNSELNEFSNKVELNTVDPEVPESNCLALTVRKDYNITIVKNIFTTTGRLSWKIILSTIVLNFLRMLF